MNRRVPVATLALLAAQGAVYLWERQARALGLLGDLFRDFGFRWTAFVAEPAASFPSLLSHMFFHSDVWHIAGNAAFFLLCGPVVERAMGGGFFAGLYVVWGVAAAFVQGFFDPYGGALVGSSGAISGAAGAFLVLFPLTRPHRALWPMFLFLAAWFLWNVMMGFQAIGPASESLLAPVGYWAHVGGFAAGALSSVPFWRKKTA